jgi:mRNA interferase RelE/StbE
MIINVTSKQKANYKLEVTPRFDSEFLKLPMSIRLRISTKIDELETTPYSNKALHGDMTGLFSLRVGDYRVIYSVNEVVKRILLLSVKHRKHAYDQL